MGYDNKNFDPKAAAEARKAEMDAITKKLEQGVKDVFQGDNYKKYLNFCARLPRYSVNNQLLIMMQKPDATLCQSFTEWKDMNRFVKKGEKGIRILAPSPYKVERDQEKKDEAGNPVRDASGQPVMEKVEVTINAFKPVSTFDVSQTEGEPIPSLGVDELKADVAGYENLFEAIKEIVPVPITFEKIESGAKGYFSPEGNRIAIREGMGEAQTVKTAIHEAAHQALHSGEAYRKSDVPKSRNQKATEAESVAYVVCQHFGIDTADYSFGYLAGWSGDKEVPELKASLDTIRRTASGMITKIEEKLQGLEDARQEQKNIDQFMEAHGDELPFVEPEADQNAQSVQNEKIVKIEPPVEKEKLEARSKSVTISREQKEPEKKASVKEKLAEGKAKIAKKDQEKRAPRKELDKAM